MRGHYRLRVRAGLIRISPGPDLFVLWIALNRIRILFYWWVVLNSNIFFRIGILSFLLYVLFCLIVFVQCVSF